MQRPARELREDGAAVRLEGLSPSSGWWRSFPCRPSGSLLRWFCMAWLMRLLLRLPASGGQAALARYAMGVRFAKTLEAHWKYRGFSKSLDEKGIPEFQK